MSSEVGINYTHVHVAVMASVTGRQGVITPLITSGVSSGLYVSISLFCIAYWGYEIDRCSSSSTIIALRAINRHNRDITLMQKSITV